MGYKMNGFSGFGNSPAKQKSPTKWVAIAAKIAGSLIGANKRRQASKDAADAAKAKGVQDVLSKKVS